MANNDRTSADGVLRLSTWIPEIRWILAALSPMAGIFVAMLSFVASPVWLTRLCASKDLIRGSCHASWYRTAETLAATAGFGVAAALFVLLPAILAPSGKRTVAMTALSCGLVLVSTVSFVLPIPALVALVSGVLVVFVIYRLHPSAA